MKYDIDTLIEIFSEHAIEAKKNKEKDLKDYKKNYPGEPIPAHMVDDFCITEALSCMCQEIADLKRIKNPGC